MNVDLQVVLPLIGTAIGIYSAYIKIKEIQNNELKEKFKEIKQYVEKEIAHNKEIYTSEIKDLEKKIEDLRDDLRKNQDQLISLLTKDKK